VSAVNYFSGACGGTVLIIGTHMHDWKPEDIDAMLAYLPRLEADGFVPCTWEIIPGSLPYPTYHPDLESMMRLVFGSSAAIDPYGSLPEDPPGLDPHRIGELPREFYESASLDQIRRYLAQLVRAERFCDGSIESQFENGTLFTALRRVRDLRLQMG
jgi:hypothetical protein